MDVDRKNEEIDDWLSDGQITREGRARKGDLEGGAHERGEPGECSDREALQ